MVALSQLWIPILLSAVFVFVASSLIHMVSKWHNADYLKLANEDAVRSAIRASSPAPGQYVIPHYSEVKDMQSPEAQRRYGEGPVGILTLRPSGAPRMGAPLALWFILSLAVALVAAYLASRSLPAGASYAHVFRVVSIVSFIAYATGSVQNAIWMGKPWLSAAKEVLDALIYALLCAAVFAGLWPSP